MPEIAPFIGIRYNLERIGDAARVVAPPYDVISPAEQDALLARHPQNCVRLILDKERPGDTETDNRYTRAAAALNEWLATGVLEEDPKPAMYAYEQQFDWEGRRFTRRGFLTALRLSPFGKGLVFPHEFTLPGPKADRLALMKATGANLSPIFGLFPDDDGGVAATLAPVWRRKPAVDITDEKGVRHRLWVVTDAKTLGALARLMAPKPLYIADGHHRYETCCAYAKWVDEEGKATGDLHRFCLMMCVAMNDQGLAVMPTHRLLSGLGDLSADALVDALAADFDVKELAQGERTPGAMTATLASLFARHAFGLVAERGRRAWVLTLRDEAVLDRRPGAASRDWRRLDVAILADLIIDETLTRRLGRHVAIAYDHEAESTWKAVETGACQLAFLVNSTPVERVQAIAAGGERMPPKSTFFYPKLLTGLVFRRLR
jgi:uncharacterized protein (DUF1015 family)